MKHRVDIPVCEDCDDLPLADLDPYGKCSKCCYPNAVIMYLGTATVLCENPDVQAFRIRFDVVCPKCGHREVHRLMFKGLAKGAAYREIESAKMAMVSFGLKEE